MPPAPGQSYTYPVIDQGPNMQNANSQNKAIDVTNAAANDMGLYVRNPNVSPFPEGGTMTFQMNPQPLAGTAEFSGPPSPYGYSGGAAFQGPPSPFDTGVQPTPYMNAPTDFGTPFDPLMGGAGV